MDQILIARLFESIGSMSATSEDFKMTEWVLFIKKSDNLYIFAR